MSQYMVVFTIAGIRAHSTVWASSEEFAWKRAEEVAGQFHDSKLITIRKIED